MVLHSQYLEFLAPTPQCMMLTLTLVSSYSSFVNISCPLSLFQHHNMVQSLLLYLTTFNNPNLFSYTGTLTVLLYSDHTRVHLKLSSPALSFFKVEKRGKQETISVDRLELARVDPSTIVLATPKIQPSTSKTTLSPPDMNVIQPLVSPPLLFHRHGTLGQDNK